MITFTLLVWFTMKYIWPPLIAALEIRKNKIAAGLAAAEKGQQAMDLAEKSALVVLKQAKEQSSEMVGLAQQRANEVVEQSKVNAKKEGDRMIAMAKAQIEQELQQVKENLRQEVSTLALKAAEHILNKEINKAEHKTLIAKVASQLG
jgi:F-type H+-transporting ATPase subunit b